MAAAAVGEAAEEPAAAVGEATEVAAEEAARGGLRVGSKVRVAVEDLLHKHKHGEEGVIKAHQCRLSHRSAEG